MKVTAAHSAQGICCPRRTEQAGLCKPVGNQCFPPPVLLPTATVDWCPHFCIHTSKLTAASEFEVVLLNTEARRAAGISKEAFAREGSWANTVIKSQLYLRMMSNFNVGANWVKCPGSAGVQVSLIVGLQHLDEISTFFLRDKRKASRE